MWLIPLGIASVLLALEIDRGVEKRWLCRPAFGLRFYPESPPWTRHYKWMFVIGFREYRRRV